MASTNVPGARLLFIDLIINSIAAAVGPLFLTRFPVQLADTKIEVSAELGPRLLAPIAEVTWGMFSRGKGLGIPPMKDIA